MKKQWKALHIEIATIKELIDRIQANAQSVGGPCYFCHGYTTSGGCTEKYF